MWLTFTGHITMWPTSKEFTRVNNLVHISMWLTLNEFCFDHVMLVREVISQRVWTFQNCVLYEYLCHLVDATTRYLEPFQITALLYESGLLLRVIRISVKVCIDVTLYAELFITSIIEKHFLILLRIILTAVQWSVPGSPLYPLDQLMARHTTCAVHSIAYYRAYV